MAGNNLFVFTLLVLWHSALGISLFYLGKHCEGTINVGTYNQIRLNLTRNSLHQGNYDCDVTLETYKGHQLMAFFYHLDAGKDVFGECTSTWIELHDGTSRSNDFITSKSICGKVPPSSVYHTSGRYMTAYFRSDDSVQRAGFEMIITSYHTGTCSLPEERHCLNDRCISRELTCNGNNPCGDYSDCESSDKETSEQPCDVSSDCVLATKYMDTSCNNFINIKINQMRLKLTAGLTYASNMRCQVSLDGGANNKLMFYFQDMNIQLSNGCTLDYLELTDGSSIYDPHIGESRECGHTPPAGVFTTSGRYLTLYFISDGSDQFHGFDMIITTFHTGSCRPDEHRCNNNRCILDSLTCNGHNPCGDYSDCESSFETVLPSLMPQLPDTTTSPETTTSSKTTPSPVTAMPSTSQSFITSNPPIQSSIQPTSSHCTFKSGCEYMENWCGRTITVRNNQISLQLTAYSAYASNMGCKVTIDASENKKLMLYFNFMDIENSRTCEYDSLEMMDGPSRFDRFLLSRGKQCGVISPAGIFTTSGRYLTLYFHSDQSGQFRGFDMIITTFHTGICYPSEYHCDNGRCISENLMCNSLNPCGDYSDCPLTTTTTQASRSSPSDTSANAGVQTFYLDEHCGTIINITSYEQLHLKLTRNSTFLAYLQCKVVLAVNTDDYLRVQFKNLDIEDNCDNNWLELHDGSARSDPYIAGDKHCWFSPPTGVYKTSGQFMTVYFESGSSALGTGFDLLIQPSTTKHMDRFCGTTINTGSIDQLRLKLPGLPGNDCRVTIETDYGSKMMFYFLYVTMDDYCGNWLGISDGLTSSDPFVAGKPLIHDKQNMPFGAQCGQVAPDGVHTSSGRYMTLYFQSTSTVPGFGFDMIITSYRTGLCRTWGSEYECDNDRCINASLLCNGRNSCGDYSDCNTRKCRSDEYQCNNGRCIPAELKCNSLNPCGDYSDCTTTSDWTTRTYNYFTAAWTSKTYTEKYYTSSSEASLSVGAIVGIVMGCTVILTILIVAIIAYFGRKTASRRQCRLQSPVSTINPSNFVTYTYSNPVAVNYSDPPPSYESIFASASTSQGVTALEAVPKPHDRY